MPARLSSLVLAFAALAAGGCSSMYYDTMEFFGKEKRDLLRSELTGMVDDQEEAEETFVEALDRVKALTGFDGGDLEKEYKKLKSAFEDAEDSSEQIDDRIEDIQDVATDMFAEWERELGEMQTPTLRERSRRTLQDTKQRYKRMEQSLLESRDRMQPALALLRDHVLFLKHNLNAAAVGSLGDSMGEIESSIEELKRSIEQSIHEAQGFIEAMP